MKNLKLISKRGLALFMSLVMCLSLLPATAMAIELPWNQPEVKITIDNEQGIIDQLNELYPDQASDTWYYYDTVTGTHYLKGCTATWCRIGDPNPSHQLLFSTCTHKPLSQFGVGTHTSITVSTNPNLADTGSSHLVSVTIEKHESSITLKPTPYTVDLVYTDDAKTIVDEAAVINNLRAALVDSVFPSTATVVFTGSFEAGEQEIVLTLDNLNEDVYEKCDQVAVTVTFNKGKENPPITVADNAQFPLVYNEDGTLNVERTKAQLNDLVTVSGDTLDVAITCENVAEGPQRVAVSYDGTNSELYNSWSTEVTVTFVDNRAELSVEVPAETVNLYPGADLEARILSSVTVTPWADINNAVISFDPAKEGPQEVTITWPGNAGYKGWTAQFSVEILKGIPTQVNLAGGVQIPYNTPEVIEQEIWNSVFLNVTGEDGQIWKAGDVTIEYLATAEMDVSKVDDINLDFGLLTGAVKAALKAALNKINETGKTQAWVPLAGGPLTVADLGNLDDFVSGLPIGGDKIKEALEKIDLSAIATFPAIGLGVQQVRVSYPGSEAYASSSSETAVEIVAAPITIKINSKVVSVKDTIAPMVNAKYENGADAAPDAYVIYAGMDSAANVQLYLDIPASAKRDGTYDGIMTALKLAGLDPENGVKLSDLTPTQLKGLLDNQVVKALLEKLIQSGIGQLPSIPGAGNIDASKILDALTKINDAVSGSAAFEVLQSIGDHVIITVGSNPEGNAGVYGVAAVVSDERFQPQSPVALGYLVITMEQTTVRVYSQTISVGDAFPEGLIDAGGAPYIAVYGGVEVSSGMDANLYVEFSGISGAPAGGTMTLRELRTVVANCAGNESALIAALIEKLPTLPGEDASVIVGRPSTDYPGVYAVAAAAANQGALPGVGVGTLTVIDKNMSMIVYTVRDSTGTVKLNKDGTVSGPVVVEAVPGNLEAPAGASAIVADPDNYHFVNWTRVGFPSFSSTDNPFYPGRPTGILTQIPDWITSRLPGFDKIPDLSKAAAIYVAHFEEHTWSSTETTAPTCEEDGVITSTCAGCGAVKTGPGSPKLGHDWQETGRTEGTSCVDPGTVSYECSRCPETKMEDLPAAHLNMQHVDGKAPDCGKGENGVADHWYCDSCGRHFQDQAGQTELFDNEWIIANQHTVREIPEVPSTCTTEGHPAYWVCTVCGQMFGDILCTERLETAPTFPLAPHTWDEENGKVLSTSCTEPGTTLYTCTMCGTTEERKDIPAAGHAYIASDITNIADCMNAEVTVYTCTKCGDSYSEATSGALGHNWVSVAAVAATCTASGHTAYEQCSRCSTTRGWNLIPAAGHNVVYAAAVDPTCESNGLTSGSRCSNCGEVFTAQAVRPSLGHSWDTGVVTLAPTATTAGVRTYTCTRDSSHTYTETIPATGVTYPTYPNNPSIPTNPGAGSTNPGTGSTSSPSGGSSSGVTITDNDTPLSNAPEEIDIEDDTVPLAILPGLLNTTDHMAYVKGYEDGTVRPENNITRAEVATIFYRLMTDSYREANYSTTHSFTDAPSGQWYNEAIATTAKAGLVKGYLDGTVRPENNITRAEFATLASNFLGGSSSGVAAFSDIKGHWAEEAINLVAEAGWIKGDGDGKFRPDDYITRAEAVTTINRILGRATVTAEMTSDMVVWPDSVPADWWYVAIQEATNSHDYSSLNPFECWTTVW